MSATQQGRPGRYERSFGGLVAALLVTVVVVGGLIWFLGLFRADVEVEPDEIDYLRYVGQAQDSHLDPVYPASLPEGWIATAYEVEIDPEPVLFLRMLTDDDEFVAVHQEAAPSSELVRERVDEEAAPIEIYEAPRGSVAEAWEGFEDEGGDTAYAAEVGGQTILVYGSASPEELQDLIGRLTTEPVAD